MFGRRNLLKRMGVGLGALAMSGKLDGTGGGRAATEKVMPLEPQAQKISTDEIMLGAMRQMRYPQSFSSAM